MVAIDTGKAKRQVSRLNQSPRNTMISCSPLGQSCLIVGYKVTKVQGLLDKRLWLICHNIANNMLIINIMS